MQRTLCFIFFCSLTLAIQAQQKTLLKKILYKAPYDSNFVESYYDDYLHVTLVNLRPNHRIAISSYDREKKVSLRPNTQATYGFGLDYKFLTIELTKAFEVISTKDPEKGESQIFSFRIGATGQRILASALIQSYQGLYISNPEVVAPNWDLEAKGYPKRGDVTSTVLFGSLNYFFNHTRYSTMASLWQIERQKKSAGSLVTGLTASQTSITGDSALTPVNVNPLYSKTERLKKGTNYLVGANFGYAYNFIFRKVIFFNVFFIPGVNLQYGTYETDQNKTHKYSSNVGLHGDFRIIGGYNGRKYYGGVHYSNYMFQNNLESNLEVNVYNSYLRVFFGRRFDLTPRKK